jgi:CBS domain-containing protein
MKGIRMTVLDVLQNKNREIVKVRAQDLLLSATRKMAEYRVGAAVVENDRMRLVGILSERDVVRAIAQDGPDSLARTVDRYMTTSVARCSPSDRVEKAMAKMIMGKTRHLLVSEGDAISSVVSLGDLVRYRLKEKELEAAVLLDLARMHS